MVDGNNNNNNNNNRLILFVGVRFRRFGDE